MALVIRPPGEGDRQAWGRLYQGYADFYQVNQTEEMRDRVWSWIAEGRAGQQARVADLDGQLVGFAHFRPFLRPLAASTGGYLDDLFVDPELRGGGVGRALLLELAQIAAAEGWSVIRWITAAENVTARRLYDSLATATPWVTYDMRPEAG
ncbi:GNAT family N-acetyltransferase [Falsigemmobacter faecalis]|uniref:GNAT family N-acetyltransferase n=1 Tax=Falsigemmobacter faecalis TaxID=2488730 RepID=A0A3P3DRE7_9RHOB|nr:GNAT family N-acetyltransferase [Falsigemmobacter faecalis]RRH76827.1 GNAT family N-acetyltransferase [Falsigemmobacter faecalis]